ncbi:MAG: hypothetical protein Q8P76_02815 [bacterium]|nr:hypothetical protein [bacterium]
MRTLKIALLWLPLIIVAIYALGYKGAYMGGADIRYSDRHYGHPDKVERIRIGVRGANFGDYNFIGGNWEKETLLTRLDHAKKLFAKYKLLEQVGVNPNERVSELEVIIVRHIPRNEKQGARLRIQDYSVFVVSRSGYVSLRLTQSRAAETFSEKVDLLKEFLSSKRGVYELETNGILLEHGISELTILVKK